VQIRPSATAAAFPDKGNASSITASKLTLGITPYEDVRERVALWRLEALSADFSTLAIPLPGWKFRGLGIPVAE
jgi:hypothetical protein